MSASVDDAPRSTPVEEDDGSLVLELESGFPLETIRALMDRGHHVKFGNGPFGGYQAIARDPATGVYAGASESRKDGHAAGY